MYPWGLGSCFSDGVSVGVGVGVDSCPTVVYEMASNLGGDHMDVWLVIWKGIA